MIPKKKYIVFYKGIYLCFLLLVSILLAYVAIEVINNPDLGAYTTLTQMGKDAPVEPVFGVIISVSKLIHEIIGVDTIFLVYFIHIYFIQIFLFLGFSNLYNKAYNKAFISVFFWFLLYSLIHLLIQIRFGLANSISFYVFSLLYTHYRILKVLFFSSFSFLTHYSSILIVLSNIFMKINTLFKHKIMLIHSSFVIALILFKKGLLFSFLPSFMYVRIVSYLSGYKTVSLPVVIISLILYVLLVLSPKIENRKINNLKLFGAISFIPYFIVPEYEILIRLGSSFQYLLIPYFFLTYRSKKMLLFSTLPLLLFFLYKIQSNINAFIGYL